MKIYKEDQYNQSVSKYKLLSSVAGVGSIITTKLGFHILISDVNKWIFVNSANSIISSVRAAEPDDSKIEILSKKLLESNGISNIEDQRFITFLKSEKNLPSLVALLAIPSMSLEDRFNSPNWKNHPINKALIASGKNAQAKEFMITGTHFPKWFKNTRGELKTYDEWLKIWEEKGQPAHLFAPPLDANEPIKSKGENLTTKIKKSDGKFELIHRYKELEQTNLVLVCPHGHLSDIPWSKYINLKSSNNEVNSELDNQNIFSFSNCCANPKLKWTESKTKSDGYRSIYIECENCKCGSGEEAKPKINLEGINNLRPYCPGHKPWEIDVLDANAKIPSESCNISLNSEIAVREKMQVALVTGNNIYYSNGFTSLYIPQFFAFGVSPELMNVVNLLNVKHAKLEGTRLFKPKKEWIESKLNADLLLEDFNYLLPSNDEVEEIDKIRSLFLSEDAIGETDVYENYRFQEFNCFKNNNKIELDGLSFNAINLDTKLSSFFSKILQVEDLKITQVQLDFTRVRPNDRHVIGGRVVQSTLGKNIYSADRDEMYALPANEIFGEGVFFQFNDEKIKEWILIYGDKLHKRFSKILNASYDAREQGYSIKQKIQNNGFKQYLIHSFSHMIMKELEFSCGYPTASLKERLYISDRMSGVLIYTAEGSEGSMGGLIWQAKAENILNLLNNGFSRSNICSSDPLCWESEGQGVFDLNLASCFSCSLTSETSCEEMNLGLDRRILIDEDFGFFKDFF